MTYLGSVRSPRVVNIADLRRLAKRRLPRLVFDYIDGGAEDEITLRDNVRAFREIRFRLRQGVAVSGCDLRTTVLGTTYALPFLLAPVGFSRMFIRAAKRWRPGRPARRAPRSSCRRFPDAASRKSASRPAAPLWYQLYVPGGRAVAEASIARARAAGYSVLVVTIDTPVSGMRERDYRNGVGPLLAADWRRSLPHLWQFVAHPRWVLDYLADGSPRVFPNVELPGDRTDALQRCRRAPRHHRHHVGRLSVDSRRVERPCRRKGRAHRRRCAARDRRRGRCDCRLEPRRAAARRRAGKPAGAAGSARGRRTGASR